MPLLPLQTVVAGIVGGLSGTLVGESLEPITDSLNHIHKYILLFVLLGIVGFYLLSHPERKRKR